MFINELPDDCLHAIFGHLNDLDDLINCYKVCVKWSYLVIERTRKVKYLIESDLVGSLDCVYHKGKKPIDGSVLSNLFGNLEIFDCTYYLRERSKPDDIVELVKNQESIKGLIYFCNGVEESIAEYCKQLEMVASHSVEECIAKNGANIKQLHLWNYTLNYFKEEAHFFPNLESLWIYNNEGNPDSYYDGPIMEKLKIVELSLSSYDGTDIYYGFQFMDSCPNLQSAVILVHSDRLFVDESLKHKCLQDLVLYLAYGDRIDWNELKRLFMKYPNLKHLALRDKLDTLITDERIEQLVKILPNLVLFDARECSGVTQSSADWVRDYCKRYGRSIKFYFEGNEHEIESDWPHLSTKNEKISLGFDFMKHCFLKNFYTIPVFLVPIDY